MAPGLACLLLALTALLGAAPAQAASVRVPVGYYGVNFQRLVNLGPAAKDVHLSSIASLGIDQVRFNVSWAAVEPVAPKNGEHTYRWGSTDQQVAAMARHGIRPQPTLTQTPNWDAVQDHWVELQCAKSSSRSPVSVEPYARFVRAFTARYGRGGAFWAAHPELPYVPVLRYEIWNEPNLKGGWCPRPQPWLYADMFVGAAQAIRAIDPDALVYTGGVAPPSAKNAKNHKQYLGVAEFFGKATARRPNLNAYMSGAAVHIYPSTDGQKQLEKLAWFRSQLHDGRIVNRIPMIVNEVGWATHVGEVPISEGERAAAFAKMTINYARTNCNVGGILPHTWISPQQSSKNPEDWFGIADPSTGAPYDSARYYSYGLKLMRGELPTEPPTQTLAVCPGMGMPDSDNDGFVDQSDYYPLDPTRH
jgi:polysaccharide biosynthesis protein PslG